MGIEHQASPHWSGEQLIEHLYGIGPDDGHLEHCQECRERLLEMQAHRQRIEADSIPEESVNYDFLMAQRRKIYAKIAQPENWFSWIYSGSPMRLKASAALAFLGLSGGLLFYQQKHHQPASADRVSDIQLARDVSQMAQDPEVEPTAPLQALFN
jgi:hypothetical protein